MAGLGIAAERGGFEPLDRWKAAVLAGDQTTLSALYGSSPAAASEVQFWSNLHAQGLVGMNPKVLMRQAAAQGTVGLVLRVELTFRPGTPLEKGLVSARQLWGQRDGEWRVLNARHGDVQPLPSITLPQPAVPNTHLYPDPADAKRELADTLAVAKKDHKRVLVIFGATWCYDCHVLDTTLRSAKVAPLVEANYHVLHINIGDHDANADLAERFQVPLEKGIPGLAVLDADGRVVTSSKNGEFESAARIGMKDVTGFLERWKPAKAAP